MFEYTEDVRISSSFQGKSKPYGIIEGRKTHGFLFRIKGGAKYFFNGRYLKVSEGEAIFLPKGAHYEYKTDTDRSLYTSINFEASLGCDEIFSFSPNDFYGKDLIYESFSSLFTFGGVSDKYKCLSVLYDLLSYVSRLDGRDRSKNRKFALIEPALEYLKSHIYSPALRIEKLHKLSGISDTYFRQIFTERFGVSPQQYVLTLRIRHARSIIESGDFDTVAEVAETVGYTDPLYFSKAYKKYYGFPPSETFK